MGNAAGGTGLLTAPSDNDLADRARTGDTRAFEELYRRHAQAAWRLAQAVTRNGDDAADAVSEAFTRVFSAMNRGTYDATAPFRPYLLTATRNAAIDILRRGGRTQPADLNQEIDLRDGRPTPADKVDTGADATLVVQAFRNLPERWRSVLWLTEVEGLPPREAAELLGLSANGTAQLAVRARAGLRERYLQAHVRATDDRECRRTVDHLGAYVAGGLPPRDVAKVDQHLAGCADCRARLAELEDMGAGLRKAILPLPLGLGAAAVAKWRGALAAAQPASRTATMLGSTRKFAPWTDKAVAGAAAAVVTLGVIGAAVFGSGKSRTDAAAGPLNRGAAEKVVDQKPIDNALLDGPAAMTFTPISSTSDVPSAATSPSASSDTPRSTSLGSAPSAPSTASTTPPAASTTPTTTPASTDPAPQPEPAATAPAPVPVEVSVGGKSGDSVVAVDVAPGGTTGAQVGDTVIGDQPTTPTTDGVTVSVGGTVGDAIGDPTISLP